MSLSKRAQRHYENCRAHHLSPLRMASWHELTTAERHWWEYVVSSRSLS